MAFPDTTFTQGTTITSTWLNAVNANCMESVSFKDFGAVGDGVTDDTVAVQAALDSGTNVIDGQGLTYLTSSQLTGRANTVLQNAIFTAPALAASEAIIKFTGSVGTYVSLTANTLEQTFSCEVTDASSFVVDGWAFIKSTAAFGVTSTRAEFVRIKSIVGTTLNFYDSVISAYNTADSASIAPMSLLSNVILDNVSLYGPISTNNQIGAYFEMCTNVELRNVRTYDFDYTHLLFNRCVGYIVRGGSSSRTGVQEGLDYGVAHVRGCFNGLVEGYTADSLRHVSTTGGSEGIQRFIRVVNCFGYNLTDGGIDSHDACWEHQFSNNFLSFSDAADTTIEGIVSQGGLPIITNNIIQGARRHGISWQPLIKSSASPKAAGIISGNTVRSNKNIVSSAIAILVTTSTSAGYLAIDSVNISNNVCSNFDTLVSIIARVGGEIKNVIINGNSTILPVVSRGVYVYASGSNISNVSIIGNIIEGSVASFEMIYVFGTALTTVSNVAISNNITNNGTRGIRLIYCDKVSTSNNQLIDTTISKLLWSDSTNVMFNEKSYLSLTDIQQYVVISGGVIAIDEPMRTMLRVAAEGGAATDDLDTITGGYPGQIITVFSYSTDDVVCKDGTGNLKLAGDRTLSDPNDRLVLQFDGTNWYELSFADNA